MKLFVTRLENRTIDLDDSTIERIATILNDEYKTKVSSVLIGEDVCFFLPKYGEFLILEDCEYGLFRMTYQPDAETESRSVLINKDQPRETDSLSQLLFDIMVEF